VGTSAKADRMPDRAILSAGAMTSPRRVSAFSLALTIHIVAIIALAWAVDRPVPMPTPRGMSPAPSPSATERGGASPRSSATQHASPSRQPNSHAVVPSDDSFTPEPRRVLDLLRDGAIVVATRIGLMTAPQSAADTARGDPGAGVAATSSTAPSAATGAFVDVATPGQGPNASAADIELVPLPPGTRFITRETPAILLLGDAFKVQTYPLLGAPRVMWLEVPDISRRAIRERRPTVGWWSLDTPLVQPFKLVGRLLTFQLPTSRVGSDTNLTETRTIDVLVIDRVIAKRQSL
jgi:hypothetical protein